MKIFDSYPNARMFYKVGEDYYAHNAKSHAESVSRKTGKKLEEVHNPAFAKDKAEKPATDKNNKTDKTENKQA
jgi:hypothetical protein